MSMTGVVAPDGLVAATAERVVPSGRVRGMGVFLVLLAIVAALGFVSSVSSRAHATFLLSAPPAVSVSPLTMSVRWTAGALAMLCAALGVLLVLRREQRGAYLIFGVGFATFLWAFLVWAARGAQLNFVQMLVTTLISTTPLVFGSLSGVMCERSGVINIAIEGQFLAGAFLGAMIGSVTGDLWLGMLAGAVAGGLFGLLLAFLTLRYAVDQIIVGVVIVAFCTGLTNFLTEQVLTPDQTTLNSPQTFAPIAILTNPIVSFASDNNGSILVMPSLANYPQGELTASGTLYFGINTQSNNTLNSTYSILPTPATGGNATFFSATLNGQAGPYPASFLDSGSNELFIPPLQPPGTYPLNSNGDYVPQSLQTVSGTATSLSVATDTAPLSFSLLDVTAGVNAGNTAFYDMGTTNSATAGSLDLGMPYFYGHSIVNGINGAQIQFNSTTYTGPFYAIH